MDQPSIQALNEAAEQVIKSAAARARAAQQEEFVGTAADGLVTATVRTGELSIDVHVLAKRRLEREELGAAVVEAVHEAERQAREVDTFDDLDGLENAPRGFREAFTDAMRQLRSGSAR